MPRGISGLVLRRAQLVRVICGLLTGAFLLASATIGMDVPAAEARSRDKKRSNDDDYGGQRGDPRDSHDNYSGGGGSGGGRSNKDDDNFSGNSSGNGKSGKDDDNYSSNSSGNWKNSKDDDKSSSYSDRDESDGSSRRSNHGRGAGSDGNDSDGPPRTMLDAVKRLFPGGGDGDGEQDTKKARADVHKNKWEATVNPTAAKKDDDTRNAKIRAAAGHPAGPDRAKPEARQRKARSILASVPTAVPVPEAIRRHVVLGIELSPEAIAVLGKHGFRPLVSSNVEIGHVTELAVPQGYDAISATALLKRELPAETFLYSMRYNLLPQGESKEAPDNEIAGKPCEGDRCYAKHMVGWNPALGTCASRVKVGVVDTAVDTTHPALKGMRKKHGTFGRGAVADASNWHGTGVAALMAGAEKSATPGLIPEAEFLLADIFTRGEDGSLESDTLSLYNALEWLDRLNVNVVNLSIAGVRDPAIETKIQAMARRKVVFVAAAGNDGPTGQASYPAAYKPVIAVTAVNRERNSYHNATHGSYIDVAAPGVRIWTALPDGRMGYRSGTSFAAPFVTSIVAATYAGAPVKTKEGLLRRLDPKDLGPPGRDPIYGRGLLVAPPSCVPTIATVPSVAAKPTVPATNAAAPVKGGAAVRSASQAQ